MVICPTIDALALRWLMDSVGDLYVVSFCLLCAFVAVALLVLALDAQERRW